MPRKSPYRIRLSKAERAALEAMARKYTSPYRAVIRARIVLYAAEGLRNDEIAARLDTPRQIVSKWRKRFFEQRLAGLEERERRGRPARFPPAWWSRSRPWHVRCPTSTVFLSRASASRRFAVRRFGAVSSHRLARRRCGAGSRRTPSGLGIIAAGSFRATRTSSGSLNRRADRVPRPRRTGGDLVQVGGDSLR